MASSFLASLLFLLLCFSCFCCFSAFPASLLPSVDDHANGDVDAGVDVADDPAGGVDEAVADVAVDHGDSGQGLGLDFVCVGRCPLRTSNAFQCCMTTSYPCALNWTSKLSDGTQPLLQCLKGWFRDDNSVQHVASSVGVDMSHTEIVTPSSTNVPLDGQRTSSCI